jgi:O-methyltransferase
MKKPFFERENIKLYLSEWEERKGRYRFPQSLIFPKNTYSPWLDKEFLSFYLMEIAPNTLVDIYRCFELNSFMEQFKDTQGDIIEVGVWRGGTGRILINGLSNGQTLFLCDTFEGVVKAGIYDNIYQGGEHADTSENHIKELLSNQGGWKILKGIFPDDTASEISDRIFKFCHIDVDVYQSALDIFNWVFPRLIRGGVVVFDDYGFASCEGITKLVNELRLRSDLIMTYNLNGHAIVYKS